MRLRTVDGLRGIAATGVMLFHMNVAISVAFTHWFPRSLDWLVVQGSFGVEVFFVLSGFVIPFSVRNADLSLSFLGRFALRRSIRLDPPYWAAILAETLLLWVGLRVGLADAPMPTVPQLLSHLLYLQNILGFGDVVGVFWTLCYEIQFYLAIVTLLVLGVWIESLIGRQRARVVAVLVFSTLFLVSVLGRYGLGFQIRDAFALRSWFQFFMGTCVYWLVSGKTTWRPLVATWIVVVVVIIAQGESLLQAIPIAASALLWWSYRKDGMTTILAGRVAQFLGTISYSLYLVHLIFGWRAVRVLGIVLGQDAPLPVVLAVFLVGCAVSIGTAWIWWLLLERPAMRLSKIVTMPRKTSPEAPRSVAPDALGV